MRSSLDGACERLFERKRLDAFGILPANNCPMVASAVGFGATNRTSSGMPSR